VGCGLSKAHIRPEVLVSHGNARTTVHGRKLIVARYWAGWPKAHIAVNRSGIDGGFQPPKDGSHGGTEEVPRRAA
jgi:hypothetical protein